MRYLRSSAGISKATRFEKYDDIVEDMPFLPDEIWGDILTNCSLVPNVEDWHAFLCTNSQLHRCSLYLFNPSWEDNRGIRYACAAGKFSVVMALTLERESSHCEKVARRFSG